VRPAKIADPATLAGIAARHELEEQLARRLVQLGVAEDSPRARIDRVDYAAKVVAAVEHLLE
jgi:hypothetical protein